MKQTDFRFHFAGNYLLHAGRLCTLFFFRSFSSFSSFVFDFIDLYMYGICFGHFFPLALVRVIQFIILVLRSRLHLQQFKVFLNCLVAFFSMCVCGADMRIRTHMLWRGKNTWTRRPIKNRHLPKSRKRAI